jgi:hypothetical protein
VAGRNVFSSEERTRDFFENEIFFHQSSNWNIFIIYLAIYTKKFRFFFQRDYLLLINLQNKAKQFKKIKKKYIKNRKNS